MKIVAESARFIFVKVSKRVWDDLESRAPVGSSANRSRGWLISALAQAHRCFCPPDT